MTRTNLIVQLTWQQLTFPIHSSKLFLTPTLGGSQLDSTDRTTLVLIRIRRETTDWIRTLTPPSSSTMGAAATPRTGLWLFRRLARPRTLHKLLVAIQASEVPFLLLADSRSTRPQRTIWLMLALEHQRLRTLGMQRVQLKERKRLISELPTRMALALGLAKRTKETKSRPAHRSHQRSLQKRPRIAPLDTTLLVSSPALRVFFRMRLCFQ